MLAPPHLVDFGPSKSERGPTPRAAIFVFLRDPIHLPAGTIASRAVLSDLLSQLMGLFMLAVTIVPAPAVAEN